MTVWGDLRGRKVLITGSSKGLGAVCAQAFAEAGAHLALLARSQELLEQVRSRCAEPARHAAFAVDLTDFERLAKGVAAACDHLGEVDVVLHAAGGGLGLREPLLAQDDLLRLFTLNLAAAAAINRIVAPAMQQRRAGNLVHVGSIASREAVASVGYNTVKAAVAAYVRGLGRELIKDGVIVTGLLPGGFTAPGNAMERLKNEKPDVYARFVRERLPRGHMGESAELLPLIALLASKQAGMFAGCMVPIDAGEGLAYEQH